MAFYLSEDSIRVAIRHICRFGDTDIFPHLLELLFLSECIDDVVRILGSFDIRNFSPSHSAEALAPKSRYGFRIANQLMMADCLFLTAAIIEIGSALETHKAPDSQMGPFAYRFEKSDDGSIFSSNRTYRDWIDFQLSYAQSNQFDYVIFTDIADFYQRIYFHRIENVLRTSAPERAVAYLIEKIIKKIRSKQSYGIPVGGTASRLIAEAVLADFDHTLEGEEYKFTRFVDDMRIFVTDGENPYRALSLAAETLLAEGLTLNAQKTRVLTRQEYFEYLEDEGVDTFDDAQREALLTISRSIYFEEEQPSEEQVAALQAVNLVGLLEQQLEEDHWDFGKIRSIFRALKLTDNAECVTYIVMHLETLLPFIKDIVLLFDTLKTNGQIEQLYEAERVIECLSGGAGQSVPVIRAWLIELFVRGIVPVSVKKLNDINRNTELDGRQLILAHAAIGDVSYFRKNKTRLDQLGQFEKHALIVGASCLPKDEFETWVDATKAGLTGQLAELERRFCDWAKSKHGQFDQVATDLAGVGMSVETDQ